MMVQVERLVVLNKNAESLSSVEWWCQMNMCLIGREVMLNSRLCQQKAVWRRLIFISFYLFIYVRT